MTNVSGRTEVAIRVPHTPDALDRPVEVVTALGINILATCSYWDSTGSVLLLVTEDSSKTMQALSIEGYRCTLNHIILVDPLETPACAALYGAELAASGIHVLYSYTYESETGRYNHVFSTSDNLRAIQILKTQTARRGLPVHRPDQRSRASLVQPLSPAISDPSQTET